MDMEAPILQPERRIFSLLYPLSPSCTSDEDDKASSLLSLISNSLARFHTQREKRRRKHKRMQPPIFLSTAMFKLKLLLLPILVLHQTPAYSLPLCRTQCGAVSINYPFGLDDGCGDPEYHGMLNCSMADLLFQTPSGSYKVRSIDYDKNTMVIYDPAMSTCTMLQPHHDFLLSDLQNIVIPPSDDTVFALLNCSFDSPVLNRYRSLCFNFSGHSCDELYSACSSFKILSLSNGTAVGGPSCCFTEYTTIKFMSMNILDCTHYTTVYGLDDLKGVGPMDWQYGMEMSFAVPNSGCEHCQRTGGTCGYNTETHGMLCLCSTGFNSTRECGTIHDPSVMNSTSGGSISYNLMLSLMMDNFVCFDSMTVLFAWVIPSYICIYMHTELA
ncbi:hypothetical protein ACLOJK_021984 [Asimina triloba]